MAAKYIHKFDLGGGEEAYILSESAMRPVKTIEKITPQSWQGFGTGGGKTTAINVLNKMRYMKESPRDLEEAPKTASLADHARMVALKLSKD